MGTRLQDFTTGSAALFAAPGRRIVALNVQPFDAAKHAALSLVADAREALRALTAELAGSGELIATEALASPALARRVPARDAMSDLRTDAPLAEVKEHLAGFYLIDCADAERAAQIAARIPEAAFGLVEVCRVKPYAKHGT